MEIKGKVHCFFEQRGTFKNEFIKLGIPAEDYDIQDNFGQTDHVMALSKLHLNTGQVEGLPKILSVTTDSMSLNTPSKQTPKC